VISIALEETVTPMVRVPQPFLSCIIVTPLGCVVYDLAESIQYPRRA
jgi:hypothetical protein